MYFDVAVGEDLLPQGGVAVFDIGEAAVDLPAFGVGFGSGLVFQVVAPQVDVVSLGHSGNISESDLSYNSRMRQGGWAR